MEWSILDTLNDFLYRHDAVEDHGADPGFPSDHATGAFAVAMAIESAVHIRAGSGSRPNH
jgi:membrane-associated phospholipid phosphatase